jgi:riboflavin synthase
MSLYSKRKCKNTEFYPMFTGIIESLGVIKEVVTFGTNKTFWVECPLSSSFKIDQSIAHDGVCLTIEDVQENMHKVTAVGETLKKTNLDQCKPGQQINIERSLLLNSRLDGHFVQGHVDTVATCKKIKDKTGSVEFEFEFPQKFAPLIIEKGSICINGVSLTGFNVKKHSFTVTIIPYTLQHTNLQFLNKGDLVNLEFDMIGKYILRNLNLK